MRTTLGAALLLCLTALPLRAADRDTALAVIEQAIKAQGGADALNRSQTAVRNATGNILLFGKDVPFTDEMQWQLPERFRLSLDMGTGAEKSQIVLVVAPDKGWQTTGGMVMELGRDRLDELREEAYVLWLTTLTPLVKDPAFELTPLPDVSTANGTVQAVKVVHKGHIDAQLYFDKGTGLLIKIERRAREAGLLVDKEDVYSGHKDFDGVKLPAHQLELINGKKFSELKSISYKFPRSINDSVFSRP